MNKATNPGEPDNERAEGVLAYMDQPGRLKYLTREVPTPGEGAIVMRTSLANVCGSELHIWAGKHPVKKRGGLGHEMVGTVWALGAGRTHDNRGERLRVGDRIVATYFQTCLQCFQCLDGRYNLCDNAYEFFGRQPEEEPYFHAAFGSHYYIHPKQHVYKVPDGLDDRVVSGANCALSQVMFGLDQIPIEPGQTLLIQGAGGLGINAVAVAKQRGLRVIVVDGVPARLEQALAFGADHVIDINETADRPGRLQAVRDLTEGRGPDVAVELTGVPAAFAEGLELLRRGGRYLVMGNLSPGTTVPYDPGLITRKALSINHVDRYDGRYLWKSLAFLARHATEFPFETISSTTFPFHAVQEALDRSIDRTVTRASIDLSDYSTLLSEEE